MSSSSGGAFSRGLGCTSCLTGLIVLESLLHALVSAAPEVLGFTRCRFDLLFLTLLTLQLCIGEKIQLSILLSEPNARTHACTHARRHAGTHAHKYTIAQMQSTQPHTFITHTRQYIDAHAHTYTKTKVTNKQNICEFRDGEGTSH